MLLLPVVLAAVLSVSGIAKLRRPDDLRGWAEFGVPEAFQRRWLLRLHPWGELVLAAGLLLLGAGLGTLMALGAVVLMSGYLWLIVRAVRAPGDPTCACFGAPARVTRATVLRNGWLLAVALAAPAVIQSMPAVGGAAVAVVGGAPIAPLDAALGAAVAAVTTLLVGRSSPATSTPQAPPVADAEGSASPLGGASSETRAGDAGLAYVRPRVPAVSVTLGDGIPANLRELARRSPILLLAVSETCRPCAPVIERIGAWRALLPGVEVRSLIALPPDESAITERTEPQSLHDPQQHVRASIAEWGTPTALLLGADGLLVGEPVTGYGEIAEFVADIAESLHGERPSDDELHGGAR